MLSSRWKGGSWTEVGEEAPQMPAETMLQMLVEDAEALAAAARARGVKAHGPIDAHGERMYFHSAPGELFMTIQSRLV